MSQIEQLQAAVDAQSVVIAELGQKITTEALQINAKLAALQEELNQANTPVDISSYIATIKANTQNLIRLGDGVVQIIPDEPVTE